MASVRRRQQELLAWDRWYGKLKNGMIHRGHDRAMHRLVKEKNRIDPEAWLKRTWWPGPPDG